MVWKRMKWKTSLLMKPSLLVLAWFRAHLTDETRKFAKFSRTQFASIPEGLRSQSASTSGHKYQQTPLYKTWWGRNGKNTRKMQDIKKCSRFVRYFNRFGNGLALRTQAEWLLPLDLHCRKDKIRRFPLDERWETRQNHCRRDKISDKIRRFLVEERRNKGWDKTVAMDVLVPYARMHRRRPIKEEDIGWK